MLSVCEPSFDTSEVHSEVQYGVMIQIYFNGFNLSDRSRPLCGLVYETCLVNLARIFHKLHTSSLDPYFNKGFYSIGRNRGWVDQKASIIFAFVNESKGLDMKGGSEKIDRVRAGESD